MRRALKVVRNNSRRHKRSTSVVIMMTAAAIMITTGAGRFAPAATFTLDPNGTTLPATQVAADWSRGSNVLVRVGSCTGARCIKLTEPDALTHCTNVANAVGCAGFALPDGSCGVEVWAFLESFPDARRYATAHEVGHCMGLPHLTDPRALMYPSTSLHPQFVAPTKTDKAALNALYPRT